MISIWTLKIERDFTYAYHVEYLEKKQLQKFYQRGYVVNLTDLIFAIQCKIKLFAWGQFSRLYFML